MSDPYKEAPFRVPRDLARILNKTLAAWKVQTSAAMYFGTWTVGEEVSPVRFGALSVLLGHGFKSNFSGLISPTSHRWREFEEMHAALNDRVQNRNNLPGIYVPPPAPGPTLQELPRKTVSPLEELFRKKRDDIFREMIGTPDEYNIWGYRVKPEAESHKPAKAYLDIETVTGFDLGIGRSSTQMVLFTLGEPNANGDVISKDCKITTDFNTPAHLPLQKGHYPGFPNVIPGYGDEE